MPSSYDHAYHGVRIDISEDDINSTIARVDGYELVAVRFPAAMDSTNISFACDETDDPNGTFVPVLDDTAGAVVLPFTANSWLQVPDAARIAVAGRVRIVADTNELADRLITLILKAR